MDANVALIISNYLQLNAVEGMSGYGYHEEVNKSSPQKKKKYVLTGQSCSKQPFQASESSAKADNRIRSNYS